MTRLLIQFAATFAGGWLLGAAIAHVLNVRDDARNWDAHVKDALDVWDRDH